MTAAPERLEAMIGEVKRELALRANVYPRMIASGKLKREQANKQTDLMHEILALLESLRPQQEML